MKNRKSPRWANCDYSTEGYYFVTICTKDRIHYFGEIDNSDDNNDDVGNGKNDDVGNENPVVGNRHACSLRRDDERRTEIKRNNERIPAMVGSFKSAVTNKIRKTGLLSFQWQKSFHDRIIRDEIELYNVRNYIRNNPRNWFQDELKEAA